MSELHCGTGSQIFFFSYIDISVPVEMHLICFVFVAWENVDFHQKELWGDTSGKVRTESRFKYG